MNYEEIIRRVSTELNLPYSVVDKTYKSYWLFIKDTIQSLPLKEELSEEEFTKIRTNINIPSIGKIICPYSRYLGVRKRFEHIKKIRSKHEETN